MFKWHPLTPLLLTLPLLSLFAGCQNSSSPPKSTTFSGVAMTMNYRLTVGHSLTSHQLKKIKKIVLETFDTVDNLYNKYNPNSEITRFNQAEAGIALPLSDPLYSLFLQTDKIFKLSDGLFDPTIEPLHALWKNKLESGDLATEEEIKKLLPAIGWDKLQIADGSVTKSHRCTSVDFGGIAKGLCIDLIVEQLNSQGYSNLFVEWGGEIRTSGVHPDNRPWNIAIRNIEELDTSAVTVIPSSDGAIATSGDYQQFWRYVDGDGKTFTYFHIIHPKTFKPLEATEKSVASVTVKAPNCMLADALATTVMLFTNYQDSVDWASNMEQEIEETSFWIMTRDHANQL